MDHGSNNIESAEPKYFKEYKYPNGRVLRLTKEQFYAVVDVFRMLARQDEKLRRQQEKEVFEPRSEE